MFTDREVIDAIRRMRKVGSDTQAWEVKESVLDLPRSLPETISAFANLHGGMIILGLSERNGENADCGRRTHARRAHGD